MSKILVPSRGLSDWRRLLADPQKHWRAGFSAMAAARSWEAADGLPSEIAKILGAQADLIFAIPEHKVPLPGGRRESQCDVFALVRVAERTVALAVEAKVAEPFDRTIGAWLADGSAGKQRRLAAICEILGCPEPPPDLRYQLFHRTAAAVVEARRMNASAAAMIVHSFSGEHRWFEDFAAFCGFLGLKAVRSVPLMHNLPDGRELILGWATGNQRYLAEGTSDGPEAAP
ncbi:DUF6946 family protein [Tranquillimonas alkanivorans]|uniref:DUF6946 domain-containing protein n=1 Tax=Tranquillimonas alkanivorans TaxID=441119 RepID=A0A1I5VC64_9RHOB|nr:hypothetical protein [Tranquillimonas alkanivorans]SFQ05099.1 hypothetical protein SAMN04488047_12915 [Tranquillimonas alkanivorans]